METLSLTRKRVEFTASSNVEREGGGRKASLELRNRKERKKGKRGKRASTTLCTPERHALPTQRRPSF